MLSFAKDIRPLFRPMDVQSMRRFFDLHDYAAVKQHAQAIYEAVADGTMPCDAPWPEAKVARFKQWMDANMPE
jgi:hypothetical protein